MGIDYEVCSVCGEGFPDVMDYGFCGNCEETLCEGCLADMQEKYGIIGEEHDNAVNVGEDAPVKCDECARPQLSQFDKDEILQKENDLLASELKSIAKCLNEYFDNENDAVPVLDILSAIQEDVNELLKKLG